MPLPQTKYKPVRNLALAKFYYQGNHSHPIRRTVIITEYDRRRGKMTGHEIRCGKTVRKIEDAPVRTYTLSEIARYGDYSRIMQAKKNHGRWPGESTFQRFSLRKLESIGA